MPCLGAMAAEKKPSRRPKVSDEQMLRFLIASFSIEGINRGYFERLNKRVRAPSFHRSARRLLRAHGTMLNTHIRSLLHQEPADVASRGDYCSDTTLPVRTLPSDPVN